VERKDEERMKRRRTTHFDLTVVGVLERVEGKTFDGVELKVIKVDEVEEGVEHIEDVEDGLRSRYEAPVGVGIAEGGLIPEENPLGGAIIPLGVIFDVIFDRTKKEKTNSVTR
jgi:hypothetical protein